MPKTKKHTKSTKKFKLSKTAILGIVVASVLIISTLVNSYIKTVADINVISTTPGSAATAARTVSITRPGTTTPTTKVTTPATKDPVKTPSPGRSMDDSAVNPKASPTIGTGIIVQTKPDDPTKSLRENSANVKINPVPAIIVEAKTKIDNLINTITGNGGSTAQSGADKLSGSSTATGGSTGAVKDSGKVVDNTLPPTITTQTSGGNKTGIGAEASLKSDHDLVWDNKQGKFVERSSLTSTTTTSGSTTSTSSTKTPGRSLDDSAVDPNGQPTVGTGDIIVGKDGKLTTTNPAKPVTNNPSNPTVTSGNAISSEVCRNGNVPVKKGDIVATGRGYGSTKNASGEYEVCKENGCPSRQCARCDNPGEKGGKPEFTIIKDKTCGQLYKDDPSHVVLPPMPGKEYTSDQVSKNEADVDKVLKNCPDKDGAPVPTGRYRTGAKGKEFCYDGSWKSEAEFKALMPQTAAKDNPLPKDTSALEAQCKFLQSSNNPIYNFVWNGKQCDSIPKAGKGDKYCFNGLLVTRNSSNKYDFTECPNGGKCTGDGVCPSSVGGNLTGTAGGVGTRDSSLFNSDKRTDSSTPSTNKDDLTKDAPGPVNVDTAGAIGGAWTGFVASTLPCLPAMALTPISYWGCRALATYEGGNLGNKAGDYVYNYFESGGTNRNNTSSLPTGDRCSSDKDCGGRDVYGKVLNYCNLQAGGGRCYPIQGNQDKVTTDGLRLEGQICNRESPCDTSKGLYCHTRLIGKDQCEVDPSQKKNNSVTGTSSTTTTALGELNNQNLNTNPTITTPGTAANSTGRTIDLSGSNSSRNLTPTSNQEKLSSVYCDQKNYVDEKTIDNCSWKDVGCGIMSGAMVMGQATGKCDPGAYNRLLSQHYEVTCNGSNIYVNKNALESIGYTAIPVAGSTSQIKEQIKEYAAQGIPVWINAYISPDNGTTWIGHNTIAIGVDANNEIIFNDPWYGSDVVIPDNRIDIDCSKSGCPNFKNYDGTKSWIIYAFAPPENIANAPAGNEGQ